MKKLLFSSIILISIFCNGQLLKNCDSAAFDGTGLLKNIYGSTTILKVGNLPDHILTLEWRGGYQWDEGFFVPAPFRPSIFDEGFLWPAPFGKPIDTGFWNHRPPLWNEIYIQPYQIKATPTTDSLTLQDVFNSDTTDWLKGDTIIDLSYLFDTTTAKDWFTIDTTEHFDTTACFIFFIDTSYTIAWPADSTPTSRNPASGELKEPYYERGWCYWQRGYEITRSYWEKEKWDNDDRYIMAHRQTDHYLYTDVNKKTLSGDIIVLFSKPINKPQ